MRRALTAWLLFVAALASWVGPRVVTYVCSMDGRARSHCCCEPHQQPEHVSRPTAVERTGCCEVRSEAVVATPTVSDPERLVLAVSAAFADSSSVDEHERAVDLQLHAPRGPPRGIGPPVHLRCCVFLI